ncbi:MAG: hypothetical protein WA324_30400 [Bryobacteraceae bacterium]
MVRCTCGAYPPEDARFCHKCARPLREDDVESVEPAVSAIPPPLPATPPPLPIGPKVSFSNGRAVSITMISAACALAALCVLGLLSPMLVPLGLCGAGFLAVRLYARRALQPPTMAEGARLGWMTGLWLFLTLAVLVAITSLSINDPNFRQVFKNWAGSPEAARLVDDPHQFLIELVRSLVTFFVVGTLMTGLGGILAARILPRGHSRG